MRKPHKPSKPPTKPTPPPAPIQVPGEPLKITIELSGNDRLLFETRRDRNPDVKPSSASLARHLITRTLYEYWSRAENPPCDIPTEFRL